MYMHAQGLASTKGASAYLAQGVQTKTWALGFSTAGGRAWILAKPGIQSSSTPQVAGATTSAQDLHDT